MGGGHQVCLPVTAGSPPSREGGSVYSLIMSDLEGNQSTVGFHSHPGKIIININPFPTINHNCHLLSHLLNP